MADVKMEKSEIKKTIVVNSNPANVFRKISDENELKKWWDFKKLFPFYLEIFRRDLLYATPNL